MNDVPRQVRDAHKKKVRLVLNKMTTLKQREEDRVNINYEGEVQLSSYREAFEKFDAKTQTLITQIEPSVKYKYYIGLGVFEFVDGEKSVTHQIKTKV